jgi:hypothetical protein
MAMPRAEDDFAVRARRKSFKSRAFVAGLAIEPFVHAMRPPLAQDRAETNRSLDKIGAGCWYAGQYPIGSTEERHDL